MEKIFWREKGTKRWHEGWIIIQDAVKVYIGLYNGATKGSQGLFDVPDEIVKGTLNVPTDNI